MNFTLPTPPRCAPRQSRDSVCKNNAWIANAGWRLRSQIAELARCGQDTAPEMPVVLALAVPEGGASGLYDPVGPVMELLCRHGVIAAKRPVRGLSLVWHDEDHVAITLEPAPLQVAG